MHKHIVSTTCLLSHRYLTITISIFSILHGNMACPHVVLGHPIYSFWFFPLLDSYQVGEMAAQRFVLQIRGLTFLSYHYTMFDIHCVSYLMTLLCLCPQLASKSFIEWSIYIIQHLFYFIICDYHLYGYLFSNISDTRPVMSKHTCL